jgi:nucleoside phosphorylase
MENLPSRKEFQIGWICALPIEAAAAILMLDENFGILQEQEKTDTNIYTLGRIGHHYIVIACLSNGQYGTTSVATVANNMAQTFSDSLRIALMVGIGGGAPSAEHDIRLGDIVVSHPEGSYGGVIQYDMGKISENGKIQHIGSLNSPPKLLLNALAQMRAAENNLQYHVYLQEAIGRNARTRRTFDRPDVKSDRLFKIEHGHSESATSCDQCPAEWEEDRITREDSNPQTHYGTIASGNTLIKDGKMREAIRKDTGVLCFEMEAAGLMTDFPCLVIRGICDYADSHKNKQWQGYAALAAAAFTKELLGYVPKDSSQQSPEEANLISEELIKTYPPSMTENTATESSALSHDIWSSKDARETGNVSTKGTSMDPGDQEMDQDPGDNESIYTSDVPQSLAYIQELSKSFLKKSELPDAKSLGRIREILPELLRGFAQRIGGENHDSVHFQVMKFINKKRV